MLTMHRSVTFSEIFSSTVSDDLSKYNDSYDSSVKEKFIAKIGIGLVEFMLSSIFLCYGIIFSECVKVQYYTIEIGLWTTILYTSIWNAAGPWSRYICEYFENSKYSKYVIFRYIAGVAIVLLFIGLIIPGQVLSFGVFGGICCNLIYTQLRLIAIERFNIDLKVFEGNVQVARALNLLIMPHFVLLLVTYYTTCQIKLILAAFLLNVFPAVLIIRPRNDEQKYAEISRYQTLPAFSNQIREMMDFTNSVHLSDHNRSETSSSEDEEEEKEMVPSEPSSSDFDSPNEQLVQQTYLTPLTVQNYYKNAGVNILPEIPEETENDLNDNAVDTINSSGIKRISIRLEEINHKSKVILKEIEKRENSEDFPYADNKEERERKDSIKEILNINDLILNKLPNGPETIQNIEYIQNYSDSNTRFLRDLRTIKTSFCCGCSPYRKFIWKRRFRNITDFLLDNIFKPLSVSLKDIHFYPTILSKVATSVVSTIYITLAPYMASEEINFQPEDATFLLSYIAFSWCLFLVLLPLVINFSNGKLRVTFICGLLLTGTSMTLVSRTMTNDVITISCLLFGFGYGATSYTENMVYRSFIGARKWSMIKGTLETVSALFVILTYYIIYRFKFNLKILLLAAFASYYLNALLWIVIPILKKIIVFLKQRCRRRNQQHSFL